MERRKKRTGILAAAALMVCLACAFAGDYLLFMTGDHVVTRGEESAVFTDGREAFGLSDCMIANGVVTVTGVDPHFSVFARETETTEVHILFLEPVEQETWFQLFFALPGEEFTEESSVRIIIEGGTEELQVAVPPGEYNRLRFDFESDVAIREILSGNVGQVELPYRPQFIRILLFALEAFLLICCLALLLSRRQGEGKGRFRGRPLGTILLCNGFLSMTAVFFQPLTEGLVRFADFPFDGVWGVQLLLAAGFTLALSCLMMLLPPRGGMTAASVSLGAGTAFLAQCLLLNAGKPLAMDENWPVRVENVYIWFGIVIIIAATVIYYSGTSGPQIRKALCAAAGVLLLLQAVSFTVLATSREEGYRRKEIQPQEFLSGETDADGAASGEMGFGELMKLSMKRGMPYLLKSEKAE